jgi:hypothetical protein
MTTEDLAVAGIPPSSENVPLISLNPSVRAVRESESCEDGEIRSGNDSGDGEDLSNVDANLNELVGPKSSYPPTFVFGRSKVTAELINEYEDACFFPSGDGRPRIDEEIRLQSPTRFSFLEISSLLVSGSLATVIYLKFLIDFR